MIEKNSGAKTVQNINNSEQVQEVSVLLKILALGNQEIKKGKVQAANDVIKHIRVKRRKA